MNGRLDHCHLECRLHRALEQVAAARCTVVQTKRDVHRKTGFAWVVEYDIADTGQHLALLVNQDLAVGLAARSNHPAIAFEKAPSAVSDAALSEFPWRAC